MLLTPGQPLLHSPGAVVIPLQAAGTHPQTWGMLREPHRAGEAAGPAALRGWCRSEAVLWLPRGRSVGFVSTGAIRAKKSKPSTAPGCQKPCEQGERDISSCWSLKEDRPKRCLVFPSVACMVSRHRRLSFFGGAEFSARLPSQQSCYSLVKEASAQDVFLLLSLQAPFPQVHICLLARSRAEHQPAQFHFPSTQNPPPALFSREYTTTPAGSWHSLQPGKSHCGSRVPVLASGTGRAGRHWESWEALGTTRGSEQAVPKG